MSTEIWEIDQSRACVEGLSDHLGGFVTAYDNPNAPENFEFWSKVVHRTEGGSGPRWLSGWITTVFCVFDKQGRWQGDKLAKGQHGSTPYPTFPYSKIHR